MKQALDALMVNTMRPRKNQILLFNVFYGHKDDFTPDNPLEWKCELKYIDSSLYREGVVFDALLYDVICGGNDKELHDSKRFTVADLK